jgi:hypothetical protein
MEKQPALGEQDLQGCSDVTENDVPERIRRALAAIGSASDLQYDDEFEVLKRIRHASPPTPPINLNGP